LNAKLHQQEAEIVAQAGQRGAVTIATNMAGRGTDIKLGEGVNELGGLYVLGTERHESRRIDRQLRGRCARQGDNGLSKFLVSLEDDLLRIFGSGPLARILNNTFQEGAPLDHPLLNRSIERAQKTVEGQNYSMRKRLLQFDDVLNKQREIIYGLRNECMHSDTPRKLVFDFIIDELDERISNIMPADGNPEPEALQELCSWVTSRIPMAVIPEQLEGKDAEDMRNVIMHELEEVYKVREEVENPDALKAIERFVVLHALDKNWQDHLTEMEDLRRSIGLRGYGQKDPLNEYKSEAFKFFEALMGKIRNDVMLGLFRSASSIEVLQAMLEKLDIQSATSSSQSNQEQNLPKLEEQPVKAEQELKIPEIQLPKIGRNDTVVISKGGETQKIKFKKAERLIKEEGWRLEEW
jgi:preprotein translocase subunit SecA